MGISRTLIVGGFALFGALGLACGGSGDGDGGSETPTAAATTAGPAAVGTPLSLDAPLMVNGLPACLPPGTTVKGSPFTANADPIKGGGGAAGISLVPAAGDIYAGDINLVMGITDISGQPIGDAQVRLTLYDLSGNVQTAYCQLEPVASAPGTEEEFVHLHEGGVQHTHGGEDADRAAYYSHVTFPKSGPYGVAAEAILKDGTRRMATVLVQVAAKPAVPAVGEPALRSDNLTRADVADIREIDSGDPPNDMHDLKIKDVLAAGRPLVIVFSTPAYCTSAFCGPVNQEVEVLHDEYKGQVDFVHVEIWRDRTTSTLNPTAREWLIRADGGLTEPFVYVIDKNGVIFDRWEGPVAKNIMEESVKAVAAGATYKP
ncbi:MAG: TlpA family protein disulfide reductase [Dehalococcoidia bacterium]